MLCANVLLKSIFSVSSSLHIMLKLVFPISCIIIHLPSAYLFYFGTFRTLDSLTFLVYYSIRKLFFLISLFDIACVVPSL